MFLCHGSTERGDRKNEDQKSEKFKRFIKESLVNRLIDYGEWFMGYKDKMKFEDSVVVTHDFLNICYLMGV